MTITDLLSQVHVSHVTGFPAEIPDILVAPNR
jgi:hypothetical protein